MKSLNSWVKFLILTFVVFVPTYFVGAASDGHLKYFGYFGDGKAADGTYKDYANVVWLNSNQYDTGICGISPGNDKTCQIKDAVAHGNKVVLSLQTYLLFADTPASYARLCDTAITSLCIKDYISNWDDYKQYIKPYVDDGSIIALYIMDEPVLYYGDRDLVRRGIYDTMYERLDLVTKLIKKDFPNLPLATTLLPSSIMKLTGEYFPQQVQKPSGEWIAGFQEPLPIPSGFDWLGFDCYSDWDNCYKSGISITQLHNALKAKLNPRQKIFLVPDGFLYVDENYKTGDTPPPAGVASLLDRVNKYYQLAQNDGDVVAMFPYAWGDYDGLGHLYAKNIPPVKLRYEEIGKEIITKVPPTLSFTVSPTTIDYGTTSTLTWIIGGGGTESCTVGGAWGPLTQSDPQYLSKGTHTQTTGNLKVTSTFTMFCSGLGGNTPIQSATVSVRSNPTTTPPPTPLPTPPPTTPPTTTPPPTPLPNPPPTIIIPGCENRTFGFSTISGKACNASVPSTTRTLKLYNFGAKTLKNGDSGEAVRELQRYLNETMNLGLVLDGKLGPKTIAVIKKWQENHGLMPDGLVGTKTKTLMNSLVK